MGQCVVISSWACTGKSYIAQNYDIMYKDIRTWDLKIVDLDSGKMKDFDRTHTNEEYLNYIVSLHEKYVFSYIPLTVLLVSAHSTIKEGLMEHHIPSVFCYPDISQKDAYLEALEDRASIERGIINWNSPDGRAYQYAQSHIDEMYAEVDEFRKKYQGTVGYCGTFPININYHDKSSKFPTLSEAVYRFVSHKSMGLQIE